jgi:hypothetical protein
VVELCTVRESARRFIGDVCALHYRLALVSFLDDAKSSLGDA